MNLTKRLPAIGYLCLVLLFGSISTAFAGEEFVVRGSDWTASSEEEKLAFLAGMSTMIEIEQELQAKSRTKNTKSSIPVLVDGLKDMTIVDIVNAVDAHYAGNRNLDKPVFIVIWDLAKANQ
jgi:hypothetical protein